MRFKCKISKWIMNPLIGLLITMGTNSNVFTILAVLLAVLCIAMYNNQDSLCILLFCMSFVHIFKITPHTTTFFPFLILFYVGWHMLKERVFIYHRVVFEALILTCYVAIVHFANGMAEISQLIKFVSNFLFLYVATREVNYKKPQDIFLTYIFGVLFASLLKYSGIFPNIALYTEEPVYLYRFTGMHGDPNYYGVNVIVALCLVVIMYHRKDIPAWLTMLLAGTFIWLGSLTASKMVFLMFLFPALLLIYSNHVNRRYILQMCFIGIIFVVVLMVLSGEITSFDAVLKRFDEADDAESLTTGRSGKVVEYFGYIFSSFWRATFGLGLNAPYVQEFNGVPHNTYIDFFYDLGMIGTILWWTCIIRIFKLSKRRIKRRIINFALFMCVLTMWFALSELTYFDVPFHLFLAYVVWNIPMFNSKKTECRDSLKRYSDKRVRIGFNNYRAMENKG